MANSLLYKNRILLNKQLRNIKLRKFFTPALLGQYSVVAPMIKKYAKGWLLDVGCGDMPYREIIEEKVERYDTLDVEKRDSEVTYLGDVQDMNMISSGKYDTVVCFDVLEHVKEPLKSLMEIGRIMKEGGYLLISVPHLSRLHEEPNDYYRFTKHAIRYLVKKAGLEVVDIVPTGGFLSFIGHQWSSFFILTFWHIPVVKHILFIINKYICVKLAYFLDNIFDKNKKYALGYVALVRK